MYREFPELNEIEDADGRQKRLTVDDLPTFEEAVFVHLDSLFAFAMRLAGGSRDVAQELVQETCLRAFVNYRSLRSPASVKSWLFQILVNVSSTQFQRQQRQVPIADVELADDLLEKADAQGPLTPEQELLDKRLDRKVEEAFDSLPAEFQTVVWLSDVEGLNYREISEILNCPMGTVASRLYRGHRMLRERLLEYAKRRGVARE